ncbi:hypothetical protein V5O48_019416, partial [Marasmius crinis-equi]
GRVSEKSLGKRRAVDVEQPRKPAKRLRKRSSVLIDSEAEEVPEGEEEEEEDSASHEMALEMAGDDPQDLRVMGGRVGGGSEPQGAMTDPSTQGDYDPFQFKFPV